uniref:Uncharacterized protein n=1 Tax=Setaria italica TaxID=4555 RepID=K3YNT2_SETIT
MHACIHAITSLYKNPINSHSFSLHSKNQKRKQRLNQSKWKKKREKNPSK